MQKSLLDSLESINSYIVNGSGSRFVDYMSYYDDRSKDLDRDFFTTTINSDPKIQELVEKILTNLKIPRHQWGRYLGSSLTVHDFLEELSENNKLENTKLKQMLDVIDIKSRFRWDKTVLGGLLLLLGIELTLPFGGGSVIQQVVVGLLFSPVVSAVYSLGVVLYSLYQGIFDTSKPLLQRIQDNFFKLANAGLKFAGACVISAAAVVASPVASILFVVAAGVSVSTQKNGE